MDLSFDKLQSPAGPSIDAQVESARRAAETDVDVAAKKFEELFATLLVKEMRKALPEGPFGQGPGADVYEGWFDEHVGAALARGGTLELAQVIRASLGAEPKSAGHEAPSVPLPGAKPTTEHQR